MKQRVCVPVTSIRAAAATCKRVLCGDHQTTSPDTAPRSRPAGRGYSGWWWRGSGGRESAAIGGATRGMGYWGLRPGSIRVSCRE